MTLLFETQLSGISFSIFFESEVTAPHFLKFSSMEGLCGKALTQAHFHLYCIYFIARRANVWRWHICHTCYPRQRHTFMKKALTMCHGKQHWALFFSADINYVANQLRSKQWDCSTVPSIYGTVSGTMFMDEGPEKSKGKMEDAVAVDCRIFSLHPSFFPPHAIYRFFFQKNNSGQVALLFHFEFFEFWIFKY